MNNTALAQSAVCNWPHQDASRYVVAAGMRWHIQQFGNGPHMLLIHGTGSAGHSWRDIAPILARHFTVTVPDLPGHGFTTAPSAARLSLPAMAAALAALLKKIYVSPRIAAGHSAGAAVLVRMALDATISPATLVSINGALLPLRGLPRWLYSPMAKMFAKSALVPRIVARRAMDTRVIARLIDDTGSKLDAAGVELYRQLAQRPEHVAAALGMMANWDLRPLKRQLPTLTVPLSLWAASRDRTIAPSEALRVQSLLPSAEFVSLGALGHLAHEERPTYIAELLMHTAARFSVPCGPAVSGTVLQC